MRRLLTLCGGALLALMAAAPAGAHEPLLALRRAAQQR